MSSPKKVHCGVPQGSILGPLLFTIYVNDLPWNIVSGSTYLYADDTTISVRGLTSIEIDGKLNRNLHCLATWFRKNKLSLNLSKCKFMIFGTCHQVNRIGNLVIRYENTTLEQISSFKYLGIKLDSCLTFDEHVSYIKGKLYCKIKLLGRVHRLLDKKTALMLYKALILPVLDYCDFIYHGTSSINRRHCKNYKIVPTVQYLRLIDMHIHWTYTSL